MGSTDNPAHSGSIRGVFGRHLHLAPANGLPIALRFIDKVEDFPHNDVAGDLEAVDLLFLKAYSDQCLVNRFWSGFFLKVDVFAKPGQWDAH